MAEFKKVGWLIDGEVFDSYRDQLVHAIGRLGHQAELVSAPNPPYRWDDVGSNYLNRFPAGACVVTHGDIELATRVRDSSRWTPGAYCCVEKFFWSEYAGHLSDFLLNADHELLPFGDLRRRKDYLFDAYGLNGRFFARPDSPLKLFTGQVVSIDSFDADLEFMAFYDVPDTAMVAVSSPKQIDREWRFVVVNKAVVAGCQYKHLDEFQPVSGYDSAAYELAASVATRDYQPEKAWVIDVCRTSAGEYKVVEIGGFSFSNLYACDLMDVVSAVSEAALDEWQQRVAEA